MKTIFFDINRREQFSKQIATIIFFIDLAKKNNYLLVLPRFRFLPSERKYLSYLSENQYSYQDFSYFFDIEYLKNYYVNIIEIKDIIDTTYTYPLIINTTNKSEELYNINNNIYYGIFNGYPLKFLNKILSKDYNYKYNYDFLFFDDVLEQIKYTDTNFNQLREYLKYNENFHKITFNIINNFETKEYLAVHWRRTDFLLARRNIIGINKNKEYLVKKCKQILQKYNINHIYLSTDSNNKEELNYLYNNLPIISINNINNITTINPTDYIIIETLICVNSKVFYGTKTSLFSKNIISLRINNKNNLNFFL